MLKGIDPLLSADLLHLLASMGHGDDLAIVDGNHPAATVAAATSSQTLIRLPGVPMERIVRAVLSVFPVDSFVDDPIRAMAVVGDPDAVPEVQEKVQTVIDEILDESIPVEKLERFAFYAAAKSSFGVIQVGDARPYGCFLFRKGVVPA
ncbi:MAG: RbsD/FucU domain-containing protein [Verrucomicrobiales bacterium]|nr:RbsD/FucU domain-containing protein [Verrucomicrobiales bacterium]